MATKRIQRRRVRGWRLPENAVCVTRPSVFGNPFVVGPDMPADVAVLCYRAWLLGAETYLEAAIPEWTTLGEKLRDQRECAICRLPELIGKDLACYCAVDAAHCHADVLLEMAREIPARRTVGDAVLRLGA